MKTTIITERRIPPSEIKRWTWKRVVRHYQAAVRASWETFMLHEQAAEVGTIRALQATFGKNKPKPLPKTSEVVQDIFSATDSELNIEKEVEKTFDQMGDLARQRWEQYMQANRLADWTDGGKGATHELDYPDDPDVDTSELDAYGE